MAITLIDTKKLPRQKTPEGEASEILNYYLAGANNVRATLHWLEPGREFQAGPVDEHQLVYLMEGNGSIRLENKDYSVSKGAGVYLGPAETATIQASDAESLKLFHLVVPKSHE
jgi:glyoxylate utilization-related uncharacterized protein